MATPPFNPFQHLEDRFLPCFDKAAMKHGPPPVDNVHRVSFPVAEYPDAMGRLFLSENEAVTINFLCQKDFHILTYE